MPLLLYLIPATLPSITPVDNRIQKKFPDEPLDTIGGYGYAGGENAGQVQRNRLTVCHGRSLFTTSLSHHATSSDKLVAATAPFESYLLRAALPVDLAWVVVASDEPFSTHGSLDRRLEEHWAWRRLCAIIDDPLVRASLSRRCRTSGMEATGPCGHRVDMFASERLYHPRRWRMRAFVDDDVRATDLLPDGRIYGGGAQAGFYINQQEDGPFTPFLTQVIALHLGRFLFE